MVIGPSWKILIYYLYNWKLKVWVVWLFRVWPRPIINVRGHLKSEIYLSFESPYKSFYYCYLVSFTVHFDFDAIHVWPWRLTFRGHLRSKIFLSIETSIDFFSLSRTVFEIVFYFKRFPWFDLNLWPLEDTRGLTFFCHSKSHTSYMTYIHSIDTFFLSRTVFEIIRVKRLKVA